MEKIDLTNVEAATGEGFKKLAPGGYICKIFNVEDKPDKKYLHIEYDIAYGDYKDFYLVKYHDTKIWFADFIRSYKDTALRFFKGFITAVEESNPGFIWDFDETKLKGKYIGLVIGEEEYKANDGTIKTRTYVAQVLSGKSIKDGKFTVPELKKCADWKITKPEASFTEISDDELPF